MFIINQDVSSKVLTVGMQYVNHRGGIGGVIDVYSKFFTQFNFLCSFDKFRPTLLGKIKMIFYYFWSLIKFIFILVSNNSIRIVHLHGAAKGSLIRKYFFFYIGKYVFRKIIIFHCHSSEMKDFYFNSNSLIKTICKDFFNNVDLIICLSESWKLFFIDNFNPKSIVVLENIVEKPFHVVEAKSRYEFPISFLFLGFIGERKGIFDLLTIVNQNKSFFEGKLKFIIGGNGDSNKLISFIVDNELDNLIDYKGWVSGDYKVKLLNECDVYILPSYNEGLPLSILEAMSYGKPIISTDVGGIPEIVHNRFNGIIIRPGNLEDLYESLKYFIYSPDSINQFGSNSLSLISPYYSYNVIPKLNSIYLNLLDNDKKN